jgi:Shikimate kinase
MHWTVPGDAIAALRCSEASSDWGNVCLRPRFPGAGKSTVGRLLAAKLGLPFTDSDQVIEERAGKPVQQIFADAGDPATHALLAIVPVVYLRVGYAEALAVTILIPAVRRCSGVRRVGPLRWR